VIPNVYVIRIYRRDKKNPRLMMGIVEAIGVKRKMPFERFEDLLEMLKTPSERTIRYRKNRKGRHEKKSLSGEILRETNGPPIEETY